MESFAFNSQQKAYNLLRGQGSVETKDSGISKQSFQWADYNTVLPSYKAILKHKPPVSGEGVISSQLQNMLRVAENKSEPSFEDNKSKIYLNTMVNDEMALKPARQIDYPRTITGTSNTIDIKFIKENPFLKPEVIKDIIYTEVGVLCGNMSDQSFKMYLAHYFSTLSKTGRSVLDCILNTKRRHQFVLMFS